MADDEAINRLFLKRVLMAQGWEVEDVADGLQAVETAGRESFTAIILDVHMPRLDGISAANRIRHAERESEQPRAIILALTAYGNEEYMRGCREAGMDGVIKKPVNDTSLKNALDSYLNG